MVIAIAANFFILFLLSRVVFVKLVKTPCSSLLSLLLLKLLLADKRVSPEADDNYAIIYASKNGHTEVVKLLLADKRVSPEIGIVID